MQKTIQVENISIDIKKSKRAVRASIKIIPLKGVSVTIPYTMRYDYAEKFIHEKLGWIKTHLKKMSDFEKETLYFDEKKEFFTKYKKLIIRRTELPGLFSNVTSEYIKISVPQSEDIHSKEIQEYIRKVIIETLREEANSYLPRRVKEISSKTGLKYNKLYIKNVKTRWGSCSGVNNINLSLKLMLLPDHLIDYVIVHELAHTIEKNHSRNFWNLLEKLLPGAIHMDRELNRFRTPV